MERQKYWESKIRSRRDEPFIITIGVKWKCSDVCSWGILTDREIWTLFLHDLINSIRHSPSIFIVQLFDNMKKPKKSPALLLYLFKGWKGRGLWCPLQSRIRASQWIANIFAFISCLSSFMVRYSGVLGVEEPHQSIPNLVVKLYCGDDTVGEVLRKNSSTPEW